MISMPHWPVLLGREPLEPGTERVKELLQRLGHPEKCLPPVIHVAGTNGKGSTIAFMRAVLTAAGYRVHVYTSPHLFRFNERIVLAGDEVEDTALYAALETCRIAADGMPVTFFEGTTAAAFQLFAENPADVLLMETGMGGRLDATNVIEKPAVTVITSISLDHREYLGPDLGTIAAEKAGIAREGVPFVVAPQPREAMEVLSVLAYKTGAPLFRYGYEWHIAENGNTFCFVCGNIEIPFPAPNLPGGHQVANAGTAIAALTQLQQTTISENAVNEGVQQAKWPARLQRIHTGLATLLPEAWELWLDGAHNEGGAAALSLWAQAQNDTKPLIVVFGTTRGKEVVPFLKQLDGVATRIYAVPVMSEPKSYQPQEIVQLSSQADIKVYPVDTLAEAILHSLKSTSPARIAVCGSLFLAGDVARS